MDLGKRSVYFVENKTLKKRRHVVTFINLLSLISMMDVGDGVAIQTQSTCKTETHAQYKGGERQKYPCMIRIHWQLFRRIVAFLLSPP